MDGIQLSLFGKTYPELFPQTGERTFDASLKNSQKSAKRGGIQYLDLRAENGNPPERSWAMGSASHGGCLTLSIGASPSAAVESILWQILEEDAPEKYYFERESLRGCAAAGGTERENAAEDATGSAGRSGGARCLNPWDCQSKRIYQPDGVYPTLPAMGDGARNNQAVVYALQGNGIDRADSAGCNGRGWRESVCYTLNTIDRPAICFKAGQGARARSLGESATVSPTLGSEPGSNSIPAVCYDARGNGDGIHSPTLTGDHENRITDYTTICVMAHGQSNAEITENISPTITCNHEQPIAAYGVDCRNGALDKERTHTLQAKASGGQSLNCTPSVLMDGKPQRKYIIRRLTPLECNRLQGFPDGWGKLEHKADMNGEEAAFWENVRRTRAEVGGKPYRPCASRAALLKWYNKLHTDSAEYRMWGNGIALPNAYFVISGCAEELLILKEGAEDR